MCKRHVDLIGGAYLSQKSEVKSRVVNFVKGAFTGVIIGILILMAAAFVAAISGCDNMRMAPSEAQKQIAFQGAATARAVEAEGTDPFSPAATQLVDATAVSLAYTGVPATPTIIDYPTTVAAAGQDAARRPTADDVWSAADSWIDFGIAIAGIFGGAGGIAATQFMVKARQKSRALREVVAGNERLKDWLRVNGKAVELDAFYDLQNANQKGKTEEIVAAERARVKKEREALSLPSIPLDQIPPMPPVKQPATESADA